MRLLLCFIVLVATPARAETLESLLKTLHQAQDALALEGESARAVHDRLLQLIDGRVSEPGTQHAAGSVVAYALSGGNPRHAAKALASVPQTARNAILVRGVLAYVSGHHAEAARLLALIRPERLRGRLGSLVAMAQAGTAVRNANLQKAHDVWQRVRLEAPGTLLEEAALRRLLRLALDRNDQRAFFRLLRSYWIRFPRSAFRARVVALMESGAASFDEDTMLLHLPRLAKSLPLPVREDFYAHLARAALLTGHARLAGVAARRKTARRSPHRTRLLKELARLPDGNIEQVTARLNAMSTTRLAVNDRDLLLAARAVGRTVLAPVGPPPSGAAIAGDLTARHRAALNAVDGLLVLR